MTTKIERDRTYRHPNMIEVDLHVLRIERITPEEFWLRVCYVYRRDPGLVTEPDRVRIERKEWHKWKKLP